MSLLRKITYYGEFSKFVQEKKSTYSYILTKFHRNNPDGKYNYLEVVSGYRELKQMKDQFMQRISDVLLRANRLKDKNMDFAYLWTDSRAEYMQNFLAYGRQLTQDEVDALEENEQVSIILLYRVQTKIRKECNLRKLLKSAKIS